MELESYVSRCFKVSTRVRRILQVEGNSMVMELESYITTIKFAVNAL
jgi:hypothetical protein